MTSPLIRLSCATGGVVDTALTNWTVEFDELCTELSQPKVGEKDGSYFVRGPVSCAGARADPNITECGTVILDGDSRIIAETGEIVEGAPPPQLVHEVLCDLDIQHIIYTSHSHGTKGDRYRVAIIPDRPLANPHELRACIDWTIQKLHDAGVWLNSVKENYSWSQPWYLPRISAEDAPFLFLKHDGGELLTVGDCLAFVATHSANDESAAKVADGQSRVADPNSPIGTYIAEHGNPQSMLSLLIEHGYALKGQSRVNDEPAYRLLAPGSSSDQPGVVLFITNAGVWRAYSHHGEHDPLSHKAEDAFGIYTLLEFDGNLVLALESLGVFNRQIDYKEVTSSDPNTKVGNALVGAYRKQQQKAFNAKYGMLMIEGRAVVASREVNSNTGFVESKLSAKETIATYYANRPLPYVVPAVVGNKIVWPHSVYDDWLTSYYRRSYPQPVFAPVRGLLATTEMPTPGVAYNLFVGTNILPTKGDPGPVLTHIFEIWCRSNVVAYQYVINWLARMVQKPGEQGKTVIVIRSGEGAGKNIILDIFDRYFGSHSVMLTKPEDLAGFNDHLGLSVFVFLNEALWGGNKSVEGTMKSTITDDILLVERKYLPKFKAKNCTHIMVATNNDWAVPVGIDDRRFLILDASEERKGDFDYFSALADHIKSGGEAALNYHLLHEVDIAAFDVRSIPELNSATKLDHKIRTADSITKWWLDVLTEGGFDIPRQTSNSSGYVREADEFVEWPLHKSLNLLTKELHESYRDASHGAHKESKTTLSKKLAELMGIGAIPTVRPWNSGADRGREYVLPSLTKARETMEQRLRQKGPWHQAVDVSPNSDEGRAEEANDDFERDLV